MSDWIKKMLKDNFIEELGIELVNYDHNKIKLKMKADDKLKAPNGYIHGGAITSLADTACGIATFLNIEKGQNFTTIELKTNFISAANIGDNMLCEAILIHKGRTTQVWDAEIINESNKRKIAIMRCTQIIFS